MFDHTILFFFFFFQAEDGIRDDLVTGVQTCALPIYPEVEILKSQLARALADYDNLRKRADEERVSFIKYASRNILQSLLPVLDTFESAQTHLKDNGLAIAIAQFKEVLKSEGLEEIRPTVGQEFDENLMEAIEIVE